VSAVRLRWFLTMVAVLAAAVGATVLVSEALEGGTSSDDQVIAASTSSSTTTTTAAPTTSAPSAGDAQVSGTVTALHVEGGVVDPR
jgi:hypothetical protein